MSDPQLTEQEAKIAAILRSELGNIDNFAYEGPPIRYERIARDILRTLAADAAFAVLTGGDKPTVTANSPSKGYTPDCHCRAPAPMFSRRGKTCQNCGGAIEYRR